MKRTLLLFELIYMWLFAYSSESINFKTLEVKDGLFYNYAHAILQDSDGFMWFLSGKNMLNRYDGYNFKKYPINTLNGSGDLALREDKNKNIWITEKNRFLIYDRENDCLKRDISTVLPPGINQGDISSLFVDYDGNVWFTIQNRLSCYDMGSNKCTEFMLEDKLKWLECRSGHAYLLLENGEVQEANITTGQIRKHLSLFLSSYPHHKMYIDHTLNLWIYTLHSSEDSLLYYNTQTKELKTITNQNNENYYFVTDIIDDKKGNIWIGTDNVGISIYNMNNHTYTEVKANTYNDFSIPTNHINCFHLDKQNVMWVGTSKRGVAYTNLNNTSFNQQFTFGMDDISCILEDHDKNIWLGSDGQGIACINQKKNKFTHYTHQNSTIPGDLIVCSFLDSKGRVWFGSYGGGVFYYEKGEFHQLLYKGESPTTNPLKEIRSINEDINGNIWIGTIVDGLYCYETDGTFSSYTVENSPLSSNGITDICCQQSENIYVATTEDLHVINSYSRQISTFSTHSKKEQLSTTFISSIFKDSRELLWLGGDKGIIVYNERQDTLIYINSKNGLSHNSIRGIYEDHNKNMWITTDNGVTNVTVNNSLSPMPAFRCYRYYDEDGLGNITFNTHSIYCCQNGDILMGGMGGYIQISPKEVQYPPQTSQITFTALYIANKQIEVGEEVNGRVILPQNIQLIDEITLDYSNNNFAVSVSSLSYQSLHKNSFSYRLTGNKEWVK